MPESRENDRAVRLAGKLHPSQMACVLEDSEVLKRKAYTEPKKKRKERKKRKKKKKREREREREGEERERERCQIKRRQKSMKGLKCTHQLKITRND